MSEEPDMGGLPSWYREIFPAGPSDGFYHKLGPHSLMFVERDPSTLLVSFDNLAEAGNPRYDREAWAGKFIADNGWSHLGVFSQGATWFRDKALIDFMAHLAETGFFGQFKKVVLCGTSMGGFGALAFADLAPGATVVAFSPQTTLDRSLVPWETRFLKGQAQDWTLPRSDAADHCTSASRIFLVYDPFCTQDRQQIERLTGDNIVHLRGYGFGHKSALVLRRMARLKPVMKAAVDGTLTPRLFSELIENRKEIYLYKKTMQQHLLDRNHPQLADRFLAAFKRRRRQKRTGIDA